MPSRGEEESRSLVFVALLGLVLAHVACCGRPGRPLATRPGLAAGREDRGLYWVLIAITGAIFVLVEAR